MDSLVPNVSSRRTQRSPSGMVRRTQRMSRHRLFLPLSESGYNWSPHSCYRKRPWLNWLNDVFQGEDFGYVSTVIGRSLTELFLVRQILYSFVLTVACVNVFSSSDRCWLAVFLFPPQVLNVLAIKPAIERRTMMTEIDSDGKLNEINWFDDSLNKNY